MMDAFGQALPLDQILNTPIPFLEDLFNAQIEYLTEKNKAQQEAYKAMQNGG